MIVTYHPEDSAEPQVWEFIHSRLRETRAEMIEKRYAKLIGEKTAPLDQWRMAVLQGAAAARRVLLWHLQNLDHVTLRIEDVDPLRSELTVEMSRPELEELRAAIAGSTAMDESQRDMMIAALDADIAKAPEEGLGKAPSKSSDAATG